MAMRETIQKGLIGDTQIQAGNGGFGHPNTNNSAADWMRATGARTS
jgi:hypothetical protein